MAIYCTVVHFSRQKNHFYLLLLHVFKIKIKNEYKTTTINGRSPPSKKCLLEV